MAYSVSGIQAGLNEAKGEGELSVSGRSVIFRHGPHVTRWSCATPAQAISQLRIFRAAPKYLGAQA